MLHNAHMKQLLCRVTEGLQQGRPPRTCLRRLSFSVSRRPLRPPCCSRCCTSAAAERPQGGQKGAGFILPSEGKGYSAPANSPIMPAAACPRLQRASKPCTDAVWQAALLRLAAPTDGKLCASNHRTDAVQQAARIVVALEAHAPVDLRPDRLALLRGLHPPAKCSCVAGSRAGLFGRRGHAQRCAAPGLRLLGASARMRGGIDLVA